MANLTIGGTDAAFRGKGAAKLYILAYPTADPGTTNGDRAEAILALVDAAKPWGKTTKKGLKYSAKQRTIKYEYGDGDPTEEVSNGWESAELSGSIFEVDALHIGNVLGLQAADVLSTAATASAEGRSIAVIGKPDNSINYMAVVETPSAKIGGAKDYHLYPKVTFTGDPELSFEPDNPLELAFKLNVKPSDYFKDSKGDGVIHLLINAVTKKTV